MHLDRVADQHNRWICNFLPVKRQSCFCWCQSDFNSHFAQGPMSPAQPRPSGMPSYAPPTGMTSYVPPGQPQQRPHQPLQFPGHPQVRPNSMPGMSLPQQRPPGNQFGSPAMNMPGMPMQQTQQAQQFQPQHPMQMQRPMANGMSGMYGGPPQAVPRPQVNMPTMSSY